MLSSYYKRKGNQNDTDNMVSMLEVYKKMW